MSTDRVVRGHAARLAIWNRLFHGLPVDLEELDFEALCGDPASPDERAAYVALRSCVRLSTSGRQAVRHALRIAILYWFSNVGDRRSAARRTVDPKRSTFHLAEAVGAGLSWDEAVVAMRRRPIDFSGYLAVLELLEAEYNREWDALFPNDARASIAALRGSIRDEEYASRWRAGTDYAQAGGYDDGEKV